jgi:cell division protein FtsW
VLVVGVLMVYDASSAAAARDFGDKFYFLKDQIKWVGLGLIGLLAGAVFPYKNYYKLSLFFLLGTIILLVLVFVPGLGVKLYGASRWIDLRLFTVQPSEIAKLTVVIYLAAWFAAKEKGRLTAFLLLLGIIAGLVMLQPDMGTAMILTITGLVLYFLSGAPLRHFAALIPLGVLAVAALIKIAPYRLRRLATFLDSSVDPLGASYHLRQALIAIGSGGLTGLGLGNSRQKYSYLPEANTDSIFAIIGEELGFLGSAVILLALGFILFSGFKIAASCKDRFGQLLAAGITAWLTVQTIVNIGAMLGLLPLTGVPLPFISYGGSALVVELTGVGILLNIDKHG